MKLRRQTRNGEVKLLWCLCDHCQFGNSGGRVAPIDLESVPLGIGLSDRHYTLAHLAKYLQSVDIPGQRFIPRFMRPTVKTEWSRTAKFVVVPIPTLNIRHPKIHWT